MFKSKKLLICIFSIIFSVNAYSFGSALLNMIGENSLKQGFKTGFRAKQIVNMSESVSLAMKGLFGEIPNDEKMVIKLFESFRSEEYLAPHVEKLLNVLKKKDLSSVTDKELKIALDSLLFIAGEKSSYVKLIRCAGTCASADSILGYSLKKVTMDTLDKAFNAISKLKNEVQLVDFIKSNLKNLGVEARMLEVHPDNLRALTYFAELFKSKYDKFPGIKAFKESLIKFSTLEDGKVDLLNPIFGKFWKLAQTNSKDETFLKFSRLIDLTGDYMKKNPGVEADEAAYQVLLKKAGDDPVYKRYAERFKSKKCFQ